MRRRLLHALSFSLLLIGLSCALRVHTVGARNPLYPEPLDREAGICVVKSPEAEEFEQDTELTRKIEMLLERDGYILATSSDARYYLFFDYRIRAVMGRAGFDFISGPQTGIETVRRKGPFVHSVALRVVDAGTYRDQQTEEIVWQGGAVMSEAPTEGHRLHDVVLVAAFEQFDKQSPETTTLKLRRNDARARKLSR